MSLGEELNVATGPLVTIGLPVFNGERYLDAALASLLAQTYGDLEIIVSDNASTDGTRAIVDAAAERDGRIRYVRSDVNRGAAWNFNNTVHLGRGELFCWAAADDLRAPRFLALCVEALAGDPGAGLAYPLVVDIDEHGTELKRWGPMPRAVGPDPIDRFTDVITNERVAFSVFGLMRKSLLDRTALIGPFAGSDWALLAELALLGRFVEVPEELFLHREHAERSTRVHRHSRDRAVWFDSSKADRVTYPYWSLLRSYCMAAARHPDDVRTRGRAALAVARWTWDWKRRLAQEAKLGLAAHRGHRELSTST